MKMMITYNIVVNDIIVATSRNLNKIMDELKEIRKTESKAWLQTCYD